MKIENIIHNSTSTHVTQDITCCHRTCVSFKYTHVTKPLTHGHRKCEKPCKRPVCNRVMKSGFFCWLNRIHSTQKIQTADRLVLDFRSDFYLRMQESMKNTFNLQISIPIGRISFSSRISNMSYLSHLESRRRMNAHCVHASFRSSYSAYSGWYVEHSALDSKTSKNAYPGLSNALNLA